MASSKNVKKSNNKTDDKKVMNTKNVSKDNNKVTPKAKESTKVSKVDSKKDSSKDTPITTVGKGHLVSVEYTGTLDDGKEFDSSKGHGPLKFVAGGGQVIKGFDEAVIGMKINENKKVKIPKENAYGDVNPQLVHKVPVAKIPADMKEKLKVGGYLVMQSPTGHQIPARVTAITKQEITLDMNHPMAGKNLNFDITVKGISKADAKKEGCCGGGGSCSCSDGDDSEGGCCSDDGSDCKC